MPQYSYAIGTTIDALANLEDIFAGLPAPKHKFQSFASIVTLGDKTLKGIGLPIASWDWGLLENTSPIFLYRDALRVYCPATQASATVFIRTRTNDNVDEYKAFQATMAWPLTEDKYAGRRVNFAIQFTHMVLTAEP